MACKVIINFIAGPEKGKKFEFSKRQIVIGRAKNSDVVVSDQTVSSRHCRIIQKDNDVEIEDLGSKNGTVVDGLAIHRSVLKNFDEVKLGNSVFTVQLEEVPQRSFTEYRTVMVAGYDEGERGLIQSEFLNKGLAGEVLAFPTGEMLLIELNQWLDQGKVPDLILLDFRMPIINGVNTAIAIRATERGFNHNPPIPIIFFFNVPDAEAFRKVVAFCDPAVHFPMGEKKEEFPSRLGLLVKNLLRSPIH